MSPIDNLLNALRLNPDEDYQDDYEDDDYGLYDPEEADEREQKRKEAQDKKAAQKAEKERQKAEKKAEKEAQRKREQENRQPAFTPLDDEEDLTFSEPLNRDRFALPKPERTVTPKTERPAAVRAEQQEAPAVPRSTERTERPAVARSQQRFTAVSNSKNTRKQSFAMDEVCVFKPTSLTEEQDITEIILSGRPVIINMDSVDIPLAQRIVDFILGATYATGGKFQKITNNIFLATPAGVDISGDIASDSDTSVY